MMDYDLNRVFVIGICYSIDNDRLINCVGWLLTQAIGVVILYAFPFKSLECM